MSKRTLPSAIVLGVAAVGQIVLAFVLYREDGDTLLRNLSWVVLWISAILGWWPILWFRLRGGVAKGASYTRTTRLVTSGPYALVRHPQYLAGILLGLGIAGIVQHWIVTALGIIVAAISYLGTWEDERACMVQFGAAYEAYRQRVPRVNLPLGIGRWIARKVRPAA
jgi:protein-S-isoprenylcysteine O-methyltransferase Ste14